MILVNAMIIDLGMGDLGMDNCTNVVDEWEEQMGWLPAIQVLCHFNIFVVES